MGTKNNPGTFDCYENADPDEPMFVLLARDRAAPAIVEAWADARETALMMDSQTPAEVMAEFAQIDEARECAASMRHWRTRQVLVPVEVPE